ncbi:hypothetical protein [Cytobacillus gottheilii]|uniref:hypothetical protein n=1 Tax=Cytobacillus gottheilii TaxID=859144 RepID=UPI0009B94E1D|nr:hypothetical protein [Cytobacillus gottheilii]
MNKNRYLLCLLICGLMLYYAVPRLSIQAGGEQGLFSAVWLAFMLMAVAGNLTAMLYTPRRTAVTQKTQLTGKRKIRSYNR